MLQRCILPYHVSNIVYARLERVLDIDGDILEKKRVLDIEGRELHEVPLEKEKHHEMLSAHHQRESSVPPNDAFSIHIHDQPIHHQRDSFPEEKPIMINANEPLENYRHLKDNYLKEPIATQHHALSLEDSKKMPILSSQRNRGWNDFRSPYRIFSKDYRILGFCLSSIFAAILLTWWILALVFSILLNWNCCCYVHHVMWHYIACCVCLVLPQWLREGLSPNCSWWEEVCSCFPSCYKYCPCCGPKGFSAYDEGLCCCKCLMCPYVCQTHPSWKDACTRAKPDGGSHKVPENCFACNCCGYCDCCEGGDDCCKCGGNPPQEDDAPLKPASAKPVLSL